MVGHERTGGGRQQDLPTVGRGTGSRGTRDSEADVAVAVKLRIAGMDAHPHLDLHAVRPLLLGERLLRVGGRLSRVTSPREDDEEGFGLAIDDDSAVLVKCRLEQASMLSDDILVALA